MTEKIFGYILFIIGFSIICFSGISVYQVFTRKTQPVKLFNFPGIRLDAATLMGQSGAGGGTQLSDIMKSLPPDIASKLPPGIQEQAQPKNQNINVQPNSGVGQELISGDMLNYSSNLFSHLMLMGFIASIGYKIASLGIQLIRPIVVKLREEKQKLAPIPPPPGHS